RGRHPDRPRRPDRLLLTAGDGARHARLGSPVRPGPDRPRASRRPEPPRPLPLLRLGRAREGRLRPFRRRAPASGARSTVASGANFLVLDEPTNHLDLESREALEAALDAFPGTVLLVSHDRALLDAIAERTLAIEDGELRTYDGGWAELLRARE